jgi:hypothetical protein
MITLIKGVYLATTGLMSAYVESYKMNASSEIKASNRILATMQLGKMTAKSGLTGNKSMPVLKRSPAMDAYIVGATSYNITDATNTANQLAVKRKIAHQQNLLIISGTIGAIISVIYLNFLQAIVIVAIVIVTFVMKDIKPNVSIILLMGLMTGSIIGATLSTVIILLELTKPNSDTDVLRRVLYTLAICLTIV